MTDPVPIGGLGEIAERYAGFFVDQYGVLHNGSRPYEDALACLERLRETGRPVIVLSNSSKRSEENRRRMEAIGIPRSLYTDILTSGELVWQGLYTKRATWSRGIGRSCYLIARNGETSLIAGLDLELVAEPRNADFILLASLEPQGESAEDLLPRLEPALEKQLPLICANPDRVAVSENGLITSPGTLAALYEERGGQVHWFGKPYPELYEAAFRRVGLDISKSILAVGDSLEHDIAGGSRAGLETAFITGGIFADTSAEELSHLYRRYKAFPDWSLEKFRW